MSDYTLQATWSTKDALATGQALKAISATELGTEFDAIATASATKYDSDDIASTAQAEALTLNTVLISPSGLNDVLVDNAGLLGDFQALTDPGADAITFWDDSASAGAFLTIGSGLAITGTEIDIAAAAAGDGLTLTSGVFDVVGGDGITANAGDIEITDQAATTVNPAAITAGVRTVDVSALTTTEGNALAATDLIMIGDNAVAGANTAVQIQEAGMRVQTGQGTQTLAAADMNSIMEFTGTATLTLPLNASTALPVGVPIVLNVKHATQVLTVTAAASVTLVSVYSPGGTAAASDTVDAGGTALLYKTAADVWVLSGDTAD